MRAGSLFAGLLLAACAAPSDYTPPIHVAPGAAARAAWMGSHAPALPPPPSPAAHVHPLRPGEELGGPNAVGRPGDLLLANDEVVFVIDRMGAGAGFAESGGNLVDAADARDRKDELGQVFSYFGTFPRQGVYESLESGESPDGAAWAQAKGHELYDDKLEVVTRYTLRPGARALLLETTVTNRGDHPSDKLSFGDAIQWGGAEKFAPGKPVGFRGPSSGPFVGGVGRFTSYAITSTEGSVEGVSGGSWTDTMQTKDVVLAPGQRASYARVFVVGMRPDTASIVSELARLSGGALGGASVTLVDEAGKPVPVPADARVIVSSPEGAPLLSLHAAGGLLGGELPPGRYLLAYASGGGRTGRGAKAPVDVAAGKIAPARLTVSASASVSISCGAPPVPCKMTFEGLEGTATPEFGPAHAAGPARNQVTTATGVLDALPLAPGRYRVTLSRGPEYALASFDLDLAPGAEVRRSGTLSRVVDTSGYLAADFHQHTMLGTDAPVSTRDRVIANAAEGVEVAVASEHNVVADFEPIVRELGLERTLVSIPGDELTSDASKKPWGHANVYPLPVDANDPRGGAPSVRDRTAREVFDELRKIRAPHVLQINHPRTGITGYFDQYHFDPKTGLGSDPGYDPGFDALEVWNGRNVDSRESVLKDFFALLRTKHPVTATADTDTHGIVGQEAGYPRTYVRVDDDTRLESWDDARTADFVKGVRERRDVVLTNGPMLRVSANGAPIGGVARARGGGVDVKVHVECAPWVVVDRVRLVRASDGAVTEAAVALAPTHGASVADLSLRLSARADDAFVVIATGSRPMTPVLGGDPKEIQPYAMTGAVWVDVDGDGRALGR